MSLGNSPQDSNKGRSNFDWQRRVIQMLQNNVLATNAVGNIVSTEATLLQVSTTLQQILAQEQADFDFEIKLVEDANGDIFVWVLSKDQQTGTPTVSYLTVTGTPATPVFPVEFLNPDVALNSILAELMTANSKLLDLESELQDVNIELQNLNLVFSGTSTPNALDISTNATATVSAGATSYTLIVKQGTVDHLGETFSEGGYSFDAGIGRTFGALSFDASASTDALVIYTT
jgi:hypothetical protein